MVVLPVCVVLAVEAPVLVVVLVAAVVEELLVVVLLAVVDVDVVVDALVTTSVWVTSVPGGELGDEVLTFVLLTESEWLPP